MAQAQTQLETTHAQAIDGGRARAPSSSTPSPCWCGSRRPSFSHPARRRTPCSRRWCRWRCPRSCSSGAPTSPPTSGGWRRPTPRSASRVLLRRSRSPPPPASRATASPTSSTGRAASGRSAPPLAETLFDAGLRKATVTSSAAVRRRSPIIVQTALTAFQQVEDNLASVRLLAQEVRQAGRRGQVRAAPADTSPPIATSSASIPT